MCILPFQPEENNMNSTFDNEHIGTEHKLVNNEISGYIRLECRTAAENARIAAESKMLPASAIETAQATAIGVVAALKMAPGRTVR
jgi:hypothetical protein